MTLCVGQPVALSCCRTSNILRAFYAAVKCFCAAPIPKKKPASWRVFLLRFLLFIYYTVSPVTGSLRISPVVFS